MGGENKIIVAPRKLAALPVRRRNQLRRQFSWKRLSGLCQIHQMHRQHEFIARQFAVVVNVSEIPENISDRSFPPFNIVRKL